MDFSTPSLLVHLQIPEFTQTHVHRVGNAIQPSHPLSSSSPPAFNLSQHQGQQIWKTQQCPQNWKRSVFILIQRKTMPRNVQTTTKLHSPHALKVMLKILQVRIQQYMHHELPDVQAGFSKGRRTRDQIANFC